MKKNTEIKVKPSNFNEIRELANGLRTSYSLLEQKDVYYRCITGRGRCKLRSIEEEDNHDDEIRKRAELIYYERPDLEIEKLSTFDKYDVPDPSKLQNILKKISTEIGVVEKRREVFFIGNIRIHFDDVKDLGKFVEIEIPLTNDITEDKGNEIMEDLIKKLAINKDELIKCSYINLLEPKFLE